MVKFIKSAFQLRHSLQFSNLRGDVTAHSGIVHVWWTACWCSVCNYSFPVNFSIMQYNIKIHNILQINKKLYNYSLHSLQHLSLLCSNSVTCSAECDLAIHSTALLAICKTKINLLVCTCCCSTAYDLNEESVHAFVWLTVASHFSPAVCCVCVYAS